MSLIEYLSAVDTVAVNELYCLHTSALEMLELCTHHGQHVTVSYKHSREVETDGERLFLRWLSELDHSAVD